MSAALAGACTTTSGDQPDMQQIGNWGLGWSLRGAQNRLTAAYPGIVALVRKDNPNSRDVAPTDALRKRFRSEFAGIGGNDLKILENRFLGAFTVDGLDCAGRAYIVRDGSDPVGLFVVLEADAFAGSGKPRWCDGSTAPDIAAFILSAMRKGLLGLPG
jgi:hypothetical protein